VRIGCVSEYIQPTKQAGDECFKNGDFEDAVVAYTGALTIDKKNHILYSNRSAAYLSLGDYRNALTDAAECVRLDPTFLKGYLRKGQALVKLLLFEAATANYEEALLQFPDDPALKQAMTDADSSKRSLPDSVINAKTSSIGHSSLLVEHIVAFMRHKQNIGALWDSIRVTGEVEAVSSIDKVSISTGDGFNADMRQVATTGQFVQNILELYEVAALAQPIFNKLIAVVVGAVPDCRPDMIHLAPLKGRERATAKANDDYSGRAAGPGEAWLFDIVRASVECETEAQIAAVVAQILASPNVEVIRLKNRFRNPTPAGFRDINMNIKVLMPEVGEGVYHICELQVHHADVKDFAKKNHSHSHYEYFRVYFSGSVDAVDARLKMFEELQAFDEDYTDRKSRSEGPTVDDESILVKVTQSFLAGDDQAKLETLCGLLQVVEEQELKLACTRRLLQLRHKRNAPVDMKTIQLMNQLAASLQAQVKFPEAKAVLEEILRDMIPVVPFESEAQRTKEAAIITQSLGLLVLEMGDVVSAQFLMRPALGVVRYVRGEAHLETATCYHNMGRVLYEFAHMEEAAECFQKALAIRRAELGEQNGDVAASMIMLGEALSMLGRQSEAKDYVSQALEVSKRLSGDEGTNTLSALMALGTICLEQGEPDQALAYFQKCRESYLKMLGSHHMNCAVAMMKEASVYASQQNWPPAHALLVKALQMNNRYFNDQPHHITAAILSDLGAIYVTQMQFETAVKYLTQALEMRTKVLGPNHLVLGRVHMDLGSGMTGLNQTNDAADQFQASLRVYKANNPPPNYMAATLNAMGPLYLKMGRLKDGIAALQCAMRFALEVYPETHQIVAGILSNLGLVYRDMNMLSEAECCLTAAVLVYTATFGQDNVNTINIMGNLGTVVIRSPDPMKAGQGRELLNSTIRFLTAAGYDDNHPFVIKFAVALKKSNSPAPNRQLICANRHIMTAMTTNIPQYAAAGGHPKCDKCLGDIFDFTAGFYHCNACGYDLCNDCSWK
jgi:tetratricopeptide (TPR) repeat protein